MSHMKLKIQKLHEGATLPKVAHATDAGVDLYACEDYDLAPGERRLFKTGIAMAIPQGYVGLIWPRSGLSYKKGSDILGGVIDSGYRGDIGIILLNTGSEIIDVKKGDRIAQMLFQEITLPEIQEVTSLEESDRGEGGFGSTGR